MTLINDGTKVILLSTAIAGQGVKWGWRSGVDEKYPEWNKSSSKATLKKHNSNL